MDYPLLRPASSYEELWHQVDFATLGGSRAVQPGRRLHGRPGPGRPCADRRRARTAADADHTFGDVGGRRANRLANALTGLGIGLR